MSESWPAGEGEQESPVARWRRTLYTQLESDSGRLTGMVEIVRYLNALEAEVARLKEELAAHKRAYEGSYRLDTRSWKESPIE